VTLMGKPRRARTKRSPMCGGQLWSRDSIAEVAKIYIPIARKHGNGLRCRPSPLQIDGDLGFMHDSDGIGGMGDGVTLRHLLCAGRVELCFLEMGSGQAAMRAWFEVCAEAGMFVNFKSRSVSIDVSPVRPKDASLSRAVAIRRAVVAAVRLSDWYSKLEIPAIWRDRAQWMFSNDGSTPYSPRIRWRDVFVTAHRMKRKPAILKEPAIRARYIAWLGRRKEGQ
jgi:hypothetical protein